jgi:hypothetical protein
MKNNLASSNQPALRFRRTIMSSVATDLLTNASRSRTIGGEQFGVSSTAMIVAGGRPQPQLEKGG